MLTPLPTDKTLALLKDPLPFYLSRVPAGFPSPADDYLDRNLDLTELLIQHPAATFFCRVTGDSMKDAGIFDGDILIVDRAIQAVQGDVVVAAIAGELTCKFLDIRHRRLLPANKTYKPIPIAENGELEIEGVVIHSIRYHRG
ncbi:MAG: translesion error-prone DNA polymerase V autoproteolytic subunit [Ketobacter sp.]|nr:translesion error-prone DNA polymerase V autoproteolytic subunit [Planctomycetota bacterium]MCP5017313.1 translesion error-prone DNA polymerase V autoproteolytic subunit [Ketobacter sp.]